MADEKILEGEVLDEEELEEVAGGTTAEIKDDRKRLIRLGYYENKPHQKYVVGIANALEKLSNATGYGFKFASTSQTGNQANVYFFNGKQISRDKFWSLVDELAAK